MAGGYDPRLAENVEHLEELRQLAARLGVEQQVRGWQGAWLWEPGWQMGSRQLQHLHNCSLCDQAAVERRSTASLLTYPPAQVRFLPSFTDRQRAWLLAACAGVLYTPQHEHFGIVPLEAMAAGRPVVACDSGGPKESVLSGRTGYLCAPAAGAWADAMAALLAGGEAARMGAAARQHVQAKFSRAAFGEQLNGLVVELAAERRQPARPRR